MSESGKAKESKVQGMGGHAENTGQDESAPKEAVMFEFIKELFAFGYTAAERMEERAEEFAKMRRERMEEFRREREEMEAKIKGKVGSATGDIKSRVKHEVQAVMREVGVATQSEIEELKSMIAELAQKLDKVAGEKGAKGK